MKILNVLWLVCLITFLPALASDVDFRLEADRFIASIPPGSQHSQAAAIMRAIDGDRDGLEAIRAGRRPSFSVPDSVETVELSPSMRMYRHLRDSGQAVPSLIYFHGGGWTIGSINSCAEFCCDMVEPGGIAVIAVDYPLAPEHPFPEPLDACVDALGFAYSHAAELGIDPTRISLGGDSSGGNLAIAAALCSVMSGGAPVHSLVTFYPVVSAWHDDTPSWREYASGYALDGEYMEAFNAAYTSDSRNYLVSPSLAPDSLLAQLPPVLLVAAGRDILCDSGAAFAGRLRSLGVAVERVEIADAVHLFITVAGQPSARKFAVRRARGFLLPD